MFGETAPGAAGTLVGLPLAVAGAPVWGTALALSYAGAYGFGLTRGQALGEGKGDPEVYFDEAVIRGINSAVTEAGSELIAIPFLTSFLKTPAGKGLRNKLVDIAKKASAGYIVEGSTEAAGQAAESAVNKYLWGDEFDLQGLIDSFVVGGAWGTAVTAPISTVQNIAQGVSESQLGVDLEGAARPGFDLSGAPIVPDVDTTLRTESGELELDETPPVVSEPELELAEEGAPIIDVGEPGLDVETPEVAIEELSLIHI